MKGADQDPDLDPLVRGMDPRIRIRIHTKMSWIRNTGYWQRKFLHRASWTDPADDSATQLSRVSY